MINFKPYDGDAFKLYKDAVERKNEGSDKTTLENVEGKVENSYVAYQSAFSGKIVHLLSKDDSYSPDEKYLLKDLYSSKAKVIKDIRKWIDRNNKRTYLRKCPYCTLNRANTTEHILSKDVYPEYAIHALNLLPCCSECNSAKGEKVRDKRGNPLFINFYYHKLPEQQYLYVRLFEDKNGYVDFEYYLDNSKHTVDEYMFQLIQKHFDMLGLLKRFEEEAIANYTEIENQLKMSASKCGVKKCLEDLRNNTLEDAKEYGRNYWKVILKLALAESKWYAGYLAKQI